MPQTARPGGPHLRGTPVEHHVLQRPLPAVAASARLARVTARAACRAWRVPDAGDSAALVASELVGLALQQQAREQLTLRVLMTPRRLRLELHDGSDRLSGAAATTLLQATCVRCGVEELAQGAQLFGELALPASRH